MLWLCDILLSMNVVIFIVQINCNWLQWSNIKVYKDIFKSSFSTHLYIKKKLHSEKKSSIYTETYIFDTYIFGTDYNFMVFFVYLTDW